MSFLKLPNACLPVVTSKSSLPPIESILALNKLNLEVKRGEIFGLLGPNGAGKTTFINILGGTVMKTSGKVQLWGFDLDTNPRQVRASIGIVPQEVHLDPFFTERFISPFTLLHEMMAKLSNFFDVFQVLEFENV